MKIDPTVKPTAPSAVDEHVRSPRQETPQSGNKPRDEVELSSLSSQLHEIEAGLSAGKAVDTARVAEVKRAIADGSFKVDSEKVADRLIQATREFLLSHKS
jgi:negative regulator of flagellin synthesis FlgM